METIGLQLTRLNVGGMYAKINKNATIYLLNRLDVGQIVYYFISIFNYYNYKN